MLKQFSWLVQRPNKTLQPTLETRTADLCRWVAQCRIRGNYKLLEVVFEHTERAWRYWLSRRSHKSYINWQQFMTSLRDKLPLPKSRIIHKI